MTVVEDFLLSDSRVTSRIVGWKEMPTAKEVRDVLAEARPDARVSWSHQEWEGNETWYLEFDWREEDE